MLSLHVPTSCPCPVSNQPKSQRPYMSFVPLPKVKRTKLKREKKNLTKFDKWRELKTALARAVRSHYIWHIHINQRKQQQEEVEGPLDWPGGKSVAICHGLLYKQKRLRVWNRDDCIQRQLFLERKKNNTFEKKKKTVKKKNTRKTSVPSLQAWLLLFVRSDRQVWTIYRQQFAASLWQFHACGALTALACSFTTTLKHHQGGNHCQREGIKQQEICMMDMKLLVLLLPKPKRLLAHANCF